MSDESYVELHPSLMDHVTYPSSISLYTLRYTNSNDNWTIQAIFPDHVKYEFSEHLMFGGAQTEFKKEPYAILYELKVNVKWNDYGICSIEPYRIRISQKRANFSYHYDENRTRQLINEPLQSHQFLFDVHFEPNTFVFSPPGMNED